MDVMVFSVSRSGNYQPQRDYVQGIFPDREIKSRSQLQIDTHLHPLVNQHLALQWRTVAGSNS